MISQWFHSDALQCNFIPPVLRWLPPHPVWVEGSGSSKGWQEGFQRTQTGPIDISTLWYRWLSMHEDWTRLIRNVSCSWAGGLLNLLLFICQTLLSKSLSQFPVRHKGLSLPKVLKLFLCWMFLGVAGLKWSERPQVQDLVTHHPR